MREFLAEGTEILSQGMLAESLAGFMDDAGRAIFHWNAMGAGNQTANRGPFDLMRTVVRRRFNAASAAARTTHQATMDEWDAIP